MRSADIIGELRQQYMYVKGEGTLPPFIYRQRLELHNILYFSLAIQRFFV